MVNWKDQSVLAADQAIFAKLILALLGLYAWEMLVTMRYDITIFTGKRPFKYPMGVYLACRYALLFSLIGVTISMNATKEIDCQSLYVFNQLMGNITIGASSSLLMLRTIAIWNRRLLVFVPLIILSLGQWSILLHGVITVEAKWNPQGGVCYFSNTKQVFIDFIYIYTMVFDLTVLTISTVGLVKSSGRSDLWKLLFQDGIAYFVVAFTANCAATVMLLLNLNAVLSVIATVPACVASAIVACRGFVRLSTWGSSDVLPTHSRTPATVPALAVLPPRPSPSATATGEMVFANSARNGTKSLNEGIHISMEIYSSTDGKDMARAESPDLDKVREVDVEADTDSDISYGSAVRYTHSETARAKLTAQSTPTPPTPTFVRSKSRTRRLQR